MLSGINAGANLGEDVTYSGTVAAAMEATLLEVPSIAFSQHYEDRRAIPWKTAETLCGEDHSPADRRRPGRATRSSTSTSPRWRPARSPASPRPAQGRRKIGDDVVERADPRGRPYYWIGPLRDETPDIPGTDLHAVTHGKVSLSPIYLDLTNGPALAALEKVFS